MPRLDVNGIHLECVEQGQGAPVVLVHGTLEDYRSWFRQQEAFAREFRVIAYSRRYHYPNPARGDERDYSPSLHAHDLAGVLEELAVESAILVGASYGAYVALTMAQRYPRMVRGLVLGEPPIIPLILGSSTGAAAARAFYETTWLPARSAFEEGNPEEALRRFVDGVNAPGTYDRSSPRTRDALRQNVVSLKIETQSPNYFEPLCEQDLAQIAAPTLLLSGEHSPPHFHLILDQLERGLERVERKLIPRAGHAMNLANAEAYNDAVLEFLRRLEAGQAIISAEGAQRVERGS